MPAEAVIDVQSDGDCIFDDRFAQDGSMPNYLQLNLRALGAH